MAERSLSIRYQLKDAAQIEQALTDLGEKGARAGEAIGEGARRAGVDLNLVDKAVRTTGQGMSTLTDSARAVDRSMGTLGASAGISARALEGVRRAADPLHAAQARLARNSLLVNQAFDAGQIDAAEYALRLQQLQGRFDQVAARQMAATEASRTFAVANDNVARSGGRMGGVMQQVGFQVGDAATQIAMGGSAVQALAVQGSQLLGVFGPWGAVIGAAAVVTVALGSALFGTKKETDGASDALDTYSGAMSLANSLTGDAAKAARELAEAQRQQAIQARKTAVDQAEAAVTAVQSQISQLEAIRALGRIDAAGPNDQSDTYTQAGVQIEILRKGMADLETTLAKARIGLAEASQGVGQFGTGSARAAKATKEQKDETDALIDGVSAYIGGLQETTRLMGLDADERAKQEAVQKAQALAMRDNNLLTEDQIKLIREQIGAQQDLRAAQEADRRAADDARRRQQEAERELDRAREDAAREAERTTDRVVDYAGDTFADFFADTPKSWKDMWSDMYSAAKQTLAKLAADLILRPVIQPVVNAVYGAPGAGGVPGLGGVAGTGGAAGGGFSLSSVGDIGRIFSMGGGSLSPGLDAFAQGALGFGQMSNFAGAPAGAIGPFLPGANAGLLNGGMGGAFAGFSSLANVLGIAGAVLPGLMSGNYAQAGLGGVGAAIGTIIAPGIGTALGGMFGNLLGGLFGKGSKDELKILSAPTRAGNPLLNDTFDDNLALKSPFGYVGLSDNKTSGYDAAFVSNLAKALQRSDRSVAQYLSGEEVATVSTALQSQGGYSRRDKKFGEEEFGKVIRGRLRPILEALDVNRQLITATLSGTDAEELQAAAQELLARRQAIRDIIDYSGEEGEIRKAERSAFEQLRGAIDELSLANEDFGFSAEKAAAAQKRLVEEYLGLADVIEPMTAAEKALAAMNERIEQTAALAKQVGITLTPAEIEQKLRDEMRTGFNEGIADQILGFENPMALALREWEKAAKARLAEAKLLGADLVQVERLNAIERQKIVEQFASAATDTLRSFWQDLTIGDLSGLSPASSIAGLRASFGAAAAQALAGDTQARERVEGLGRQLLETSQRVFGSTDRYQEQLDVVRRAVGAMIDIPRSAFPTNENLVKGIDRVVDVTARSGGQQLAVQQDMLAETRALRAELAALRQEMRSAGFAPARVAGGQR